MTLPGHPGRAPFRRAATVGETVARRLDSARAALDCAVRVACEAKGVVRMDLTCWDQRAGYTFMLWTGGLLGGPRDTRFVADGPRPLDAILDMFPSVGAALRLGDGAGGVLGDAVASAELAALLPLGHGETARIVFRRIGWFGRMAGPRGGAG